MSGQRTSLASLAGAKVDKVPGHTDALMVRLPLDKLVPTPLNPRTNFGTADELTELGESLRKRQLQPVVVVSRMSYLALFPEHTDTVGPVSHVIITGERRYRGARQVDLGFLSAVILEEIAASRADVIDAVLAENIDRRNFDPIEEAHAVQTMVKECGTAVAAAERFNRTKGWVSQRLALLRLAPEAQVLVRSGKMPVRDARSLASLPADQQMRTWQQQQTVRAEDQQAKKSARSEVPGNPPAVAPGPFLPAGSAAPHPPPTHATAAAPGGRSDSEGLQHRKPTPAVLPEQSAPQAPVRTEREASPADAEAVPLGRPAGEPDWAVDDTSAAVSLARQLIGQYSTADRRRIVSYLLSIDEYERQQEPSISS